jgi:GDSL-like lipase/acylhydrolase family protein
MARAVRLLPARISSPLVVLVLIAAASGCGGDHQSDTAHGAAYVALGDSYTSGAGIEPISDAGCTRSAVDYPSLVAKALEVRTFADRSCGSATTADLEKPQVANLVRVNGPQLDAVTRDTTLVTAGIGLNNDFISIGLLITCLELDGGGPSRGCTEYLSSPQSEIERQLDAAAGQVEQALETVARKAPRATVVLVGYPRLVPDEGSCPDRLPVPDAQLTRMRDAMRYADEAFRRAADDADASYVDMYDLSEGHDICSSDPWISDYRGVPGKALNLHPFASYHEAVADAVVKLLENR